MTNLVFVCCNRAIFYKVLATCLLLELGLRPHVLAIIHLCGVLHCMMPIVLVFSKTKALLPDIGALLRSVRARLCLLSSVQLLSQPKAPLRHEIKILSKSVGNARYQHQKLKTPRIGTIFLYRERPTFIDKNKTKRKCRATGTLTRFHWDSRRGPFSDLKLPT